MTADGGSESSGWEGAAAVRVVVSGGLCVRVFVCGGVSVRGTRVCVEVAGLAMK